jgi:hypothetical protein
VRKTAANCAATAAATVISPFPRPAFLRWVNLAGDLLDGFADNLVLCAVGLLYIF